MKWLKENLRTLLFVLGATGAVATAVDLAMKQGLRPLEILAVVCAALAAFAAKWPSDVTADEAKELEARARRDSILPPGDEP